VLVIGEKDQSRHYEEIVANLRHGIRNLPTFVGVELLWIDDNTLPDRIKAREE